MRANCMRSCSRHAADRRRCCLPGPAGRIQSGQVRLGDKLRVLPHGGGAPVDGLKVTRIEKRAGVGKLALSAAVAGDIVSLAGAGDAAGIADTLAAPSVSAALDPGPIDPPTLRCVAAACMSVVGRQHALLVVMMLD